MTETIGSVELATEARQQSVVFARAFNSGNTSNLPELYEDTAVFVPEPGQQVGGNELIRRKADFMSLGLPVTMHTRQAYVAGDIALLIVDWVVEGTNPDGEHVRFEGTGTDVVRRQADGKWRRVIDNPWGTSTQSPFGTVRA